ncbi:MAG: HprK-related kinase B [Mangrovicoccus sp.]
MSSAAGILSQLDLGPAQQAEPFSLAAGHLRITVLCPEPLRSDLMAYFAVALSEGPGQITVHVIPDQQLAAPIDWSDWAREHGKSGRKDAICDLSDGRLIQKIRSGVTFLQGPDLAVAFGPVAENQSTVINFINTQILNACLREGWQLCHSAAITKAGRGLAISGLSGGGKSTSVLRLMDIPGTAFVSNDRVLVQGGQAPQALGIPKHPRINPGTILGNPKLHTMLSAARRAELEAMPSPELWQLEEKHDLMIDQIYGPGRIQLQAPLTDIWVLNWQHGASEPTQLTQVDIGTRPDLLGAIMKSPGPFYQHPSGAFEPNGATSDPAPYLSAFAGLTVCEISGRVDFDAIYEFGLTLFND